MLGSEARRRSFRLHAGDMLMIGGLRATSTDFSGEVSVSSSLR